MTPPGMVIRERDVDIIADATKGIAKQGAGEQLQAYIRSAVWPLEEPDNEASIENGIFCECCRYAVLTFATSFLLGATTSKANDDNPALLLTCRTNFKNDDGEMFLRDNKTDD
jgi:hypothetical protein